MISLNAKIILYPLSNFFLSKSFQKQIENKLIIPHQPHQEYALELIILFHNHRKIHFLPAKPQAKTILLSRCSDDKKKKKNKIYRCGDAGEPCKQGSRGLIYLRIFLNIAKETARLRVLVSFILIHRQDTRSVEPKVKVDVSRHVT